MGQRELLLLLGAITLFGAAALNTRRFMVDQDEAMLQRQFEMYAVSLAQSFLEEAKVKRFDANNTNDFAPNANDFTNAAALGPEAGEDFGNFNDLDDYDGLSQPDSSDLGVLNVTVQVGYVQEANPDVVVNTKTFYKKMTVTVSHYFLDAPVTLSTIYGYKENE